jgi:hypothetical protein
VAEEMVIALPILARHHRQLIRRSDFFKQPKDARRARARNVVQAHRPTLLSNGKSVSLAILCSPREPASSGLRRPAERSDESDQGRLPVADDSY